MASKVPLGIAFEGSLIIKKQFVSKIYNIGDKQMLPSSRLRCLHLRGFR